VAINVSLSKLPWYGQVGAFVALSLAIAGAFWNWYARDVQTSIEQRQGQLAKLRQEIDRGLATAKRLPEFRREVSSLESQLERLRAVLPEEQDVADLLRRVQAMATQSNLAILGFAPKAVAKKTMHAEWPIGLKLEGSYHDVGSFLERVSKFPRIINVGDIKIEARTNQSDGSTVTAECTATTFVLLSEAAVAAEAAKAKPTKPGAPAARKTE
jgi:type IV pilus assembly protein PilO